MGLGLAGVVLAGCSNRGEQIQKSYDSAVLNAQKAGVGVTISDVVETLPKVPDQDNAAEDAKLVLKSILEPPRVGQAAPFQQGLKPVLRDADKQLQGVMKDAFYVQGTPDLATLTKVEARLDPALRSLEQAVQKPAWDFKRDWSLGYALLLPDFARWRMLAKWLCAKALVEAHRGNVAETVAAIDTVDKLASHLETEPNLISVLAAESCRMLSHQAVLNVARIAPQNRQLLDALRQLEAKAIPKTPDIHRIWLLESAMKLETLDLFISARGLMMLGTTPTQTPIQSRGDLMETKTRMLNVLTEAENSWPKGVQDAATLEKFIRPYEKRVDEIWLSFNPTLSNIFSTGEDTPIAGALIVEPKDEAFRRLTWLALTMVMDGQSSGKWVLPKEAARPEWRDPFSGKPMLLVNDGTGFILYSVGRNKVDDGGSIANDGNGDRDFCISYPLQQKRPK